MGDRYEEKALGIVDRFMSDDAAGADVLYEAIASALREQDAWWPIDDPEHPAPRDGAELIGLAKDTNVFRIWHGQTPRGTPAWVSYGGAFVEGYITHWRPLPAPPPGTGRGS